MKYVVLLRGINVGGKRIIKMDALRAMMDDLNFKNVKTYIQSGNIIFESDETDLQKITKTIETTLKDTFGFDVHVLVIESTRFHQMVDGNPYYSSTVDIKKLHGTIVEGNIENPNLLNDIETKGDEYVIGNGILYIQCAGDYHTSPLSNNILEKKLKLTCTTRNWKTMLAIKDMA
ncbi:MAG: DUF1697 domain-containing protein [Lewinellaceae bacterium]|nr:DUF1697 domain-containing protein [Lewinellaceae bacterium]